MIISIYIIPLLLILSIAIALIKKKDAYHAFVNGAKEGLSLSVEIIPSVIAMIAAVTILKSSGLIEDIASLLQNLFPRGDYFAKLTPMIFFRPISGNASLAILSDLCKADPDGLICRSASIIQGSTDTTFYVIAFYFTSIGVNKWRHTLKAALFADFVGIFLAIVFALIFFG